jgi:nucleotide-binding universal stress UspA family protein
MRARRIMVALDGSPAALACARFAIGLGEALGARVDFVHVEVDGEVARALEVLDGAGLAARRDREAAALLERMCAEARAVGVESEAHLLSGVAGARLLAEAEAWHADLVVLGRSDRAGPGRSGVGSVAGHVLELSACPVLVVPQSVPQSVPESVRQSPD